jgi:hypothetical protein
MSRPGPVERLWRTRLLEVGLKRCAQCRLVKPVAEFHRKAEAPSGLQGYCVPCNSGQALAWQQTFDGYWSMWIQATEGDH